MVTSEPMVTATQRPAMAVSSLMMAQWCSLGISSSTWKHEATGQLSHDTLSAMAVCLHPCPCAGNLLGLIHGIQCMNKSARLAPAC